MTTRKTNLESLSTNEIRSLLLQEINHFIAAVEADEGPAEVMRLKALTVEIYALLRRRETQVVEKVPQGLGLSSIT